MKKKTRFATSRKRETVSVVTMLMECGADPTAEDNRVDTPVVAATKTDEVAVIACFIDYISRQEEEENREAKFTVRDLMENSIGTTGETLLQYAAAFMGADSICILIQNGANLVSTSV